MEVIMYCTKCGQQMEESSNFCPHCGNGKQPSQTYVVNTSNEDKTIIWLLFIFLGGYGAHRFYLGGDHTKWGIIYILTGAFCGIGWLYDLFHLSQWIEVYKQEKLRRLS